MAKNPKPHDHLAPLHALLIEDGKPVSLDDAMATCGNKAPTDEQRKVTLDMIVEDKRFHVEGTGNAALISLALSPTTAAADPARDAIAAEQKAKGRLDPFIDRAVDWIKGQAAAGNGPVVVKVDDLLAEVYATPKANAAAVLGFLKQAKMDGRLTITNRDGVNYVSYGDIQPAAATPDHIADARKKAEPVSKDTETKTLGEHLKDAQNRPARAAFEHGPGSWVAYVTSESDAETEVVVCAQIKNMQTNGGITLYTIKTEAGNIYKDVPSDMIGQLAAQELSRIKDHAQLVSLQKHNEMGQRLAQMLADEQAREVTEKEELAATRARIKELRMKIDAHLAGATLDDQQQIDYDDDGAGKVTTPKTDGVDAQPIPGAQMRNDGKPTTPAERLMARIVAKDTLELTGDNQPWEKLEAATLKGTDSIGKPAKVVPLTIDHAPGKWVVVDIQDSTAVLLRAYPGDEWRTLFEEKFGAPRDIPNQALTAKAEAGGQWIGYPVKIGRSTMHLAPLDDALLIRMPAATT